MNERIKELMVQVCKEQGLPFTVEHNRAYMLDNFSEKFAELILQDIDKIIDDLYHSMPLEQAAVLLTLDENIKQNFYEVEE
jgi:hypothetical protein